MAIDYYNMSYSTFGNYKRLVNNYDDVYYLGLFTHPDNIPVSGVGNYNGPVMYRGAIGGNISLNVDFSTRDIKGKVENASLFNKEAMRIDGMSIDQHILTGQFSNIGATLGPVDTHNFLITLSHEKQRYPDRCPMGQNRAAVPRQGKRPRQNSR